MMFEKKGLDKWNSYYWNLIKRNIGYFTFEEHEKIRTATGYIEEIWNLSYFY